MEPYYQSEGVTLYNGSCFDVLDMFADNAFDMIFADPPYMLSNDGITCRNGRMAKVNKGRWDKSGGLESDAVFHNKWICACRRVLKNEGTIWVSGTYHNIYQCGYFLQKNDFHILNDIIWFKPNASPNLSCRFFTASHETILWARKDKDAKHIFNYNDMKNGLFPEDKLKNVNAQMRSVWSIPCANGAEKTCGKHPTQKPLDLLKRIVLASTNEGCAVLDPFCGSGTTGVACIKTGGRSFTGIETDVSYCEIAKNRLAGTEKT